MRKQLSQYQKNDDWKAFFDTCISSSIELFRYQEWKESSRILREGLKRSDKMRKGREAYLQTIERMKAYYYFFEGLATTDDNVRHKKWQECLDILESLEFIPEDINVLAPCYQHLIQKSSTPEEIFVLLIRYLDVAVRDEVLKYVHEQIGSYQSYLEDMSRRHLQLENLLMNITNIPLLQIWKAYWVLMRFKWVIQDHYGVMAIADSIQAFLESIVDEIPFNELVNSHQWAFYSSLYLRAYEETIRWINNISKYIRYQPYFIRENEMILEMHLKILEFNGDVLGEWDEVISYGFPVLEFLESPQEAYITEDTRHKSLARVNLLLAKAYWFGRHEVSLALEHLKAARNSLESCEVLNEEIIGYWDQIELYHEELWRESLSLANPAPWRIFNQSTPLEGFLRRTRLLGEKHQGELLFLYLYVMYRLKNAQITVNWLESLEIMREFPWSEMKHSLETNDPTSLPTFEREKEDPTGVIGVVRALLDPRLGMSIPMLKGVLKHSPESIYVKSLLITEAILLGDFTLALRFWSDFSVELKKYKDGGDAFITVIRMAITRFLSTLLGENGEFRELPQDQMRSFQQLRDLSVCFIDDQHLKYIYLRLSSWKRGKISLWPIFD